jgi:hypothetical protein
MEKVFIGGMEKDYRREEVAEGLRKSFYEGGSSRGLDKVFIEGRKKQRDGEYVYRKQKVAKGWKKCL